MIFGLARARFGQAPTWSMKRKAAQAAEEAANLHKARVIAAVVVTRIAREKIVPDAQPSARSCRAGSRCGGTGTTPCAAWATAVSPGPGDLPGGGPFQEVVDKIRPSLEPAARTNPGGCIGGLIPAELKLG
ncbi:hypothetical protein T492DRAFT_1152728, partial [Pavlovales sp. CCMP2436]